jgi:hypothetical protein
MSHIVAFNAHHGGSSVARTSYAANCAKLFTECGVSRTSAGVLVALLHTHLQMCRQLDSDTSHAHSDLSAHTLLWIPSPTWLHLIGMKESTLHPTADLQHQTALRALADQLVEGAVSFKFLDCVHRWMSEALPAQQLPGPRDALTEAHQLRLQHVGEVLPARAVEKGLHAVLNCSSLEGVNLLLHAVTAIDASMLLLARSAHCCARRLLQLSDVTLSAISFHRTSDFVSQFAGVSAGHRHHCHEISVSIKNCSNAPVPHYVAGNLLLSYLRNASNALHSDAIRLQDCVQIAAFMLCSVAVTAQRLIAEAHTSSKSDFLCLQDCYDRGKKVCADIKRRCMIVLQACASMRSCTILQTALEHAAYLSEALSLGRLSDGNVISASADQCSLQLQLCSSVVQGQLEGCSALQSQAAAIFRLAWEAAALLAYGHSVLISNVGCSVHSSMRQMSLACAQMLNSDCELHAHVLGSSFPTLQPLLRKCSGYDSLLRIMRSFSKELPIANRTLKWGSSQLLILFCMENRECKHPSARPIIDITDIKFPSPRRM